MKDFKINVIIPVYNREKSIGRAVKSVLEQTFTDFELIVVDDCSTDNSLKVLQSFKDPRLKIYRMERNSGAAAARNQGIKKSKSTLISFLDSDDTFEKEFLKVSYETLANTSENVGFMWTGSNIYLNNKVSRQFWQPEESKDPHLTFLHELKIGIGAGITIKKKVFERCGGFNENLPAAEDTEFFFRITKFFDYTNSPLHLINIYRDSQDRMSKNFQNIARSYNLFLLEYFSTIDNDRGLQKKFYYKMMWLNYHLKDKEKANYYYTLIPKRLSDVKVKMVKFLYEYLPFRLAFFLHKKFSS